jgi:hypothetical protein
LAGWPGGAKWAEGPAPPGRRAKPLGVRLNEGLGITCCGVREGLEHRYPDFARKRGAARGDGAVAGARWSDPLRKCVFLAAAAVLNKAAAAGAAAGQQTGFQSLPESRDGPNREALLFCTE